MVKMFDYYHTFGLFVSDLEFGVNKALLEMQHKLSPEVKNEMRIILTRGRGNGRLAKLNWEKDANGMAHHYESEFSNYVHKKAKELKLTKKAKELFYGIAALTFQEGYQRPNNDIQPKHYDKILEKLE